MFSYLTPDNIFDRYSGAKAYTDSLTTPFPEFDRIRRNRPHASIDPRYPKTTDGTTASIIRKTPRRIIQQIPTGVVESDEDDAWLPIVAGFIFTNKIIPYANEEYNLIQKSWTVIEDGLSFGYCATYTPFVNHDGYFCPDLKTIYWGDVAIQPGKKSGYASNYVFMSSWWQPEDIEALIAKEGKLAASAKKRGEQYDSSWDTAALQEIKNKLTAKDNQATTAHEKERGSDNSAIQLITGFQKGVGAKFYTFNPQSRKIVRTEPNTDPRGLMPLDWFYGDTDGSNPFGRGIIELVGGLQNLIDSDMQMYQFNRALMLAPPTVAYGNVPVKKVVFEPNALIKVTDPNAKIEPLSIDTTAVANYPALYGLQKSQLLNLVSSPDTSISAEIGNPGFGKTPTAIDQQKAVLSIDDNYVRKMFETWFGHWAETAINLYFAKRSGIEELQLDDETAEELRKLAEEGKFDAQLLSEDNKIRINYDTATPALKFRVDASTSKMKDDAEQLKALGGLLQTLEGNPFLQQIIPQDKIVETWNSIVAASGVEDPEKLTVTQDDIQQHQEQLAQQAQMAQQQAQAQDAPQPKPLSESISLSDIYKTTTDPFIKAQIERMVGITPNPHALTLAEEQNNTAITQHVADQANNLASAAGTLAPQVPTQSPEDQQIIEHLKALNVPDTVIQRALDAANQGVPADQILQEIGVANG